MDTQTSREMPAKPAGASLDIIEFGSFTLARFWHWIVLCALVGTCIGVGNALTKPNFFTSSGRFMVNLGAREKRSVEAAIGKKASGPGADRGPSMKDELTILKVPEVFDRLALEVGPERILAPYNPANYDSINLPWWKKIQHRMQSWFFRGELLANENLDPESTLALQAAARKVARMADIRPDKKGGPKMLVASAKAYSPELARDVCEAFMRLCQSRHREFYMGQYPESFVSDQLELAREQQEAARSSFYEHRKECGFYDITEERSEIVKTLANHNEKSDETRIRLEEIAVEVKNLDAKLAQTEALLETMEPPKSIPNPLIDSLKEKIKRAAIEKQKLEFNFNESNKYFLERMAYLDEELADLQRRLAEADLELSFGDPTPMMVANPEHETLTDAREKLEHERERLETGLAARAVEIEEGQTTLKALAACEPFHREKAQEMEQAHSRVVQFQSAQDKEETLALLDLDLNMSSLQVITEPSFNPAKAGPKRGKTVLAGVAGGFGVGLLFALLRQLLDAKLRYPKNIERSLGVRVLGVIPEQKKWRRLGRRVRNEAV